MKIAIVTTTEKGGAGYAAQNLYKGLRQAGVGAGWITVDVLRQWRTRWYQRLKRWWLVRKNINRNYGYVKNAPTQYDYFTFARNGYHEAADHPLVKQADVVNLHWISNMIDYHSFFKKLDKPLIWTLHDVAPFTGGCHYTFGCQQYHSGCGNCMQLSPDMAFAAADNLKTKADSLAGLNPQQTVVVSPSRWLMELSQSSPLLGRFQHYHIPYGIDTDVFKPMDKAGARARFAIPPNRFVILFVGTSLKESRKGFDLVLKLHEALAGRDDILFIAAGKSEQEFAGIQSLGYLEDKADVAAACNAADVFFIPSRQDNLPNTMLEALCCGTPVMGHNIGGIPDAVQHEVNGLLVDLEDVATMQRHVLEMATGTRIFNRQQIAAAAKQKYALQVQAEAYKNLINEVLLRKV